MISMFAENSGKLSSMRVQSFIVLVVALGVFVVGHFTDKPIGFDTLLILLLFAFAPKVAQKVAEQRAAPKKPDSNQ